MNAVTPPLQALVDRDAIFALKARYARALDRHDFDVLASCFAPRAEVVYEHPRAGQGTRSGPGRDLVVERLRGILANAQRSTHFIGNRLLDLRAGSATLEVYATSHMLFAQDGRTVLRTRGLHYLDKVERIEGQCLFSEVLHSVLWEIQQPVQGVNATGAPAHGRV